MTDTATSTTTTAAANSTTLDTTIDTYLEAYGESDSNRRAALIKRAWSADGHLFPADDASEAVLRAAANGLP